MSYFAIWNDLKNIKDINTAALTSKQKQALPIIKDRYKSYLIRLKRLTEVYLKKYDSKAYSPPSTFDLIPNSVNVYEKLYKQGKLQVSIYDIPIVLGYVSKNERGRDRTMYYYRHKSCTNFLESKIAQYAKNLKTPFNDDAFLAFLFSLMPNNAFEDYELDMLAHLYNFSHKKQTFTVFKKNNHRKKENLHINYIELFDWLFTKNNIQNYSCSGRFSLKKFAKHYQSLSGLTSSYSKCKELLTYSLDTTFFTENDKNTLIEYVNELGHDFLDFKTIFDSLIKTKTVMSRD